MGTYLNQNEGKPNLLNLEAFLFYFSSVIIFTPPCGLLLILVTIFYLNLIKVLSPTLVPHSECPNLFVFPCPIFEQHQISSHISS